MICYKINSVKLIIGDFPRLKQIKNQLKTTSTSVRSGGLGKTHPGNGQY